MLQEGRDINGEDTDMSEGVSSGGQTFCLLPTHSPPLLGTQQPPPRLDWALPLAL